MASFLKGWLGPALWLGIKVADGEAMRADRGARQRRWANAWTTMEQTRQVSGQAAVVVRFDRDGDGPDGLLAVRMAPPFGGTGGGTVQFPVPWGVGGWPLENGPLRNRGRLWEWSTVVERNGPGGEPPDPGGVESGSGRRPRNRPMDPASLEETT